MSRVQRPPTSAPQRVCPRCSTLAHTAEPRCPWCGGSYRRRTLLGVAALLLVLAAVVLGGVAAMLAYAAREADREVTRVREAVEDELDGVQRSVREELDRRLPAAPAQP
jgi:uncharacterized paraquat-inducible protein A